MTVLLMGIAHDELGKLACREEEAPEVAGWQLPEDGAWTSNFDGSLCQKSRRAAGGFVLREASGQFIAAGV